MSEAGTYPEQWEADVVLSDGGTVHVRPIRRDDADRVRGLHGRLSPETVYLRFFSPLKTLPASLLERLVNVDYVDRMAIVAELGEQIIAVARYDRLDGRDEAEVAFTVDDAHQGRGLGTLLLEHLVVIARSNGIARFVAETLPHNRAMQNVFLNAGFEVTRRFEDGVVDVAFPIEPTEAAEAKAEARDHQAVANSIRRLLAPRSVAVIGASREPGTVGYELVRNLLRGRFNGPVIPVNPEAGHVSGVYAFPSIDAVPVEVDLAVIAVPTAAVEAVVEQCAQKHVDGLVVVSAGFAETGAAGAELEQRVVELARRNGMRMVGPNCMGIVNTNPDVRLNATFTASAPSPGRVGFMSQSGALGIAVLAEAEARGLGVSSFVSAGNKADVSGNDVLQYWEDDPDTDVVLLYLESFGNPRKFAQIAPRVARHKPVVAVKSARTASSTLASESHAGTAPVRSVTAALATPDAVAGTLLRQAGVTRVDTLEQLFDVAQAFTFQPMPAGRRVGIVANGGGPAVVATDSAEANGLAVPELAAGTQAHLREALPDAASLRNPVDLGRAVSPAAFEEALRAVLADDVIDAVVALYVSPLPQPDGAVARAILRAAASVPDKPLLANLLAGRAIGDGDLRVPVYLFPEAAVHALARMVEHAEWLRRPEGSVPELPGFDDEAVRAILAVHLAADPAGGWLDPSAAFDLVAAAGVPVVRPVLAGGGRRAAEVAASVGFPVAVKGGAAGLVRKTELGAVALDLHDEASVVAAVAAMEERLGDRLGGLVVQPMVEGGVELVIGLIDDPSLGPLVLFGAGGATAELLADWVLRVVPVTDVDAGEMVRSLRTSPLLFGYRGSEPVRVAVLEDVLMRVGRLAELAPEIVELDLNPVIAGKDGAWAVDVKVRLAPDVPHPERALRRIG